MVEGPEGVSEEEGELLVGAWQGHGGVRRDGCGARADNGAGVGSNDMEDYDALRS